MKTVIKKEHAELFDVKVKDGYTLAKNGVKYYISLQKHLFVCTDIDVPEDVVEVAFSSPATIKIDRGINKSFPNVKTLIIDSNVDEISIPNELFPNVIEVISYNDNYFSGPALIHINEFWGDTALYNSFCLRKDATLDLSRVEQINDYALSGCMTKQIIWCRSALHIRPHAFDGSVFDNIQPQDGVVIAGNILVDIDHDAQEIEIPSCVYNMDYSRVQLATVPKLIINNIDGMRGIDLYGLSGIVRFTKQSDLYGDEVPFWRKDTFKNTYRIEVDTDSQRYKSVDGILYSKDGKSLLKCPTKRTGKVIIPNGVTEIHACAFEGSEVESVTFPDSLKIIGSYAFRNCLYLKNVDFGNGITQIGGSDEKDFIGFGYLFEACENLKSVSIPEQVETIGYAAFSKSGIETVELPAGIKKICECAFDRCNIRRISLPAAVELGSDAISEVSEIHVEDGEHLPHGIIQSMSKYNGLAKYITPDSSLVVKITQGNKTTYIPKDFSGMHTTIDTDNPSMDDLLTFFHKNHVRILRFLVRSNAAKDFCNALSISDCSNEELLRLLSATNDKSMVIRAYILDALSEKEEKSEKLKL